jgi:N-acetylneuraminate synthase
MDNVYIIAEAGVNHNGSVELAYQLIDLAIEAGANAVKFQSFHAENLACQNAPKAEYQTRLTGLNESQFEMLKTLELSETAQVNLYRYCQQKGISFLSSPFDLESADFLINKLNCSQIKIASGEITNLPLLFKVAKANRSIILSTGMSTLGNIETALGILAYGYLNPTMNEYPSLHMCEQAFISNEGQQILQEKVSLLHCTSEYPAPYDEIHLRVIQTLGDVFGLTIGYSDHTLGTAVSIAAVACGAQIIEKHFTLDKSMQGPDHQASLEPKELISMVQGIRQVELALGNSKKIPTMSEIKNRSISRKSLVALKKIKKGDVFCEQNVGSKRPGHGVSPIYFSRVKNQIADRDYEKDELVGM